jgi:hypothetical protein
LCPDDEDASEMVEETFHKALSTALRPALLAHRPRTLKRDRKSHQHRCKDEVKPND